MFIGKKYHAIVSFHEVRLARKTVMLAHNMSPMEAEMYLEELLGSALQLQGTSFKFTENGARIIRQLAGTHGHAILKALEVKQK